MQNWQKSPFWLKKKSFPPQRASVVLSIQLNFSTLHQQGWCLHMSKILSSWTWNNRQTNKQTKIFLIQVHMYWYYDLILILGIFYSLAKKKGGGVIIMTQSNGCLIALYIHVRHMPWVIHILDIILIIENHYDISCFKIYS